MSKQTDASVRTPPNLIREETQVERESQTPQREIVMKRQVRDRAIDGEEAIGTDRVSMRVSRGGGVFVWDCVFVCATMHV